MAKITNTQVYGLEPALVYSGYSMLPKAPCTADFVFAEHDLRCARQDGSIKSDRNYRRAVKLAEAEGGGHDQFLTGITVTCDMRLSNKLWVQMERYKFMNFISSMSTVHCLKYMDIDKQCNEWVDPEVKARVKALQDEYNSIPENDTERRSDAWLRLMYSVPSGFELTAGVVTNYRCLKNIYEQRSHHPLPEWGEVCRWIEGLPLSELITGKTGRN